VKNKNDIKRIITEQFDNCATSIIVTYERDNYLAEEFNDILSGFLDENPQCFWTIGGGHWDDEIKNYEQYRYIEYTLHLSLACEEESIAEKTKELSDVVDNVVSEASKLESDYEKAKYVHDYIVENVSYDEEGYSALQQGEKVDELMYSAYGNLVNGKSVCAGYAKAFQLIMKSMGVECGYITGMGVTSEGPGAHAWNYIKIDDEYYFVDVTWDDPTCPEGYEQDGIRYDYFLINYEQISKDHIFDQDQYIPECTSTKYMSEE